MKILNKILVLLVFSILSISLYSFTGCQKKERENNLEKSETTETYNLLTVLNSSTIANYYASGSTIHTSQKGAVTIVLKDDRTGAGFRWHLSNIDFQHSTEYAIKFTDLMISGFSPATPTNAALELYWQDSSYNFLTHYNTISHLFETEIDYPNNYLFLHSFTYDTYEIRFKFTNLNISSVINKILYFNFTGIEPNGIVSFDSLSIYEIKK